MQGSKWPTAGYVDRMSLRQCACWVMQCVLLLLRRYIVIPARPVGTEGWTEEQLLKLVTRDSMIGVAPALKPDQVAQA
jgi:hypothetical protein